ncbi:MAG: hypothetical protein OXC07_01385 [Kistimonas sp.]|nr:hypothetical protein [Kistimonas sp.]
MTVDYQNRNTGGRSRWVMSRPPSSTAIQDPFNTNECVPDWVLAGRLSCAGTWCLLPCPWCCNDRVNGETVKGDEESRG